MTVMEYISNYESAVLQITNIFREIDDKLGQAKETTGIKCPEGCGLCCENPRVEATVLEFFPLALQLWKTDRAELYLEKIRKEGGRGPCVLYEPDPEKKGQGACGFYEMRGLICRLFGFLVLRDKQSFYRIITCPVIRKERSDRIERAEQGFKSGLEAPVATAFVFKFMEIDPYLGKRFLPINRAIKGAIEKIGYMLSIDHEESR